jgi:hypothetical protein
MECEICKKKLKRRIKYKEKFHDLITLNKPQSPYMILEQKEEDGDMPTIIIINPTSDVKLKVGRSHQSDIKIQDISVSRNHATLVY